MGGLSIGRLPRPNSQSSIFQELPMHPTYLTALGFLDYIGIGLFALSGALVAAQKRLDFVTFVFFAVVTGVGGGTVRDLLIGAPVFWIRENWMLVICIAAALIVW